MKRAFLIAGIALVVLTVAFLTFYFLVYRPAVPQNAVDIAVPDEDDVELTSDDRDAGVTREEKHEEIRREQNVNADNAVTITKIIDREVMNPTLSGNGERIFAGRYECFLSGVGTGAFSSPETAPCWLRLRD